MRRHEHELLLLCARHRVEETPVYSCITDAFDWDRFVTLADTHRVAELLLPRLQAAPIAVPRTILDTLQQRVAVAVGHNLARTRQAVDLLQLLNAHRIRALTFKGPAFAVAVHGHLGSRASADIDLLVHPADVSRVRPLLLANGYTLPDRQRHRAGSLLYGVYRAAGHDDTLLPERTGLAAVDVHTAFAYWILGIRLDVEGLFTRASTVDVAGLPLATLSTDDHLLVGAMHGLMHGWSELRYVSDIDGVAAKVEDWDAVLERARSANMLRALSVALLVARDLLATSLPRRVLAVAEGDVNALALTRQIIDRLFDETAQSRPWDPQPWFLSFQSGPRDRASFHIRRLTYEWVLKWPWDEWLGRRRPPATPNEA